MNKPVGMGTNADVVKAMALARNMSADLDAWDLLAEESVQGDAARADVNAAYSVGRKWLAEAAAKCKSGDLVDTLSSLVVNHDGGTEIKKLAGLALIMMQWDAQNKKFPTLPESVYSNLAGKRVGIAIGLGGAKWQIESNCGLDVIVAFAGDNDGGGFGTLFRHAAGSSIVAGSILCRNGRSIRVYELYVNFDPCNPRIQMFVDRLKKSCRVVEILCGVDAYYCTYLGNLAQANDLRMVYMHGVSAKNGIREVVAPGIVRDFYHDRTSNPGLRSRAPV